MASVFKRRRRKPIPEGATLKTFRGNPVAEWTDGRGQRQRAPLADDGKAIMQEAEFYCVEYFDHEGQRRRKGTRIADHDAAKQYANHLEAQAHNRRQGLLDPADERFLLEGQRPLAKHLAGFKAALEARGNTAKHAHETFTQATKLSEQAGAEFPRDLTASAVQEALRRMRDDGRSLSTCNHYLRSVKSFTRWLHGDRRIRHDPLASLRAFNAATDPRHVRRALTPEETAWLLKTTENRTRPDHNMPGPDRAMLYRVAFGTGFRRLELRSLTPASFDLGDGPTVTVAASYSKRRREDVQPIRPDLAERLRPWLATKPAGEAVFSAMPENTARMLRADLKAARAAWIDGAGDDDRERQRREGSDFLQYENAAGEVADFHATRHTYISGIVAGGASVKTAQELARHSTPTLTIGRYAHTRLLDLRGALDGLPGGELPEGPEAESDALRATGTDNATGSKWQQNGQQLGGKTRPRVALSGEPEGEGEQGDDSPQTLTLSRNGETRQPVAATGFQYPLGESNPCFRTENPTS